MSSIPNEKASTHVVRDSMFLSFSLTSHSVRVVLDYRTAIKNKYDQKNKYCSILYVGDLNYNVFFVLNYVIARYMFSGLHTIFLLYSLLLIWNIIMYIECFVQVEVEVVLLLL